MVGIAQSVRAPDCGSGGRGFESHYLPIKQKRPFRKKGVFLFSEGKQSLLWLAERK